MPDVLRRPDLGIVCVYRPPFNIQLKYITKYRTRLLGRTALLQESRSVVNRLK